MTEAEKALIKGFIDTQFPAFVAAEELRLPTSYRPIVSMVVNALLPMLIAALDADLAPKVGV